MKIGVVIPSHGLAEKLDRCLKHLFKSTGENELFPLIIDNGSPDDDVLMTCRSHGIFKRGIYIRLPWNASFARACNMAALAIGEVDAFLFLNNDCYLDSRCICNMWNALKTGKGSIIGAFLRYPDDGIQHGGGMIRGNWEGVHHVTDGILSTASGEVAWVTAACMLVQAKLFIQNGFNEAYENGYEDVDFCFRMKNKFYRTYYCAEATAIHEEAQTPGRKDNEDKNARLFFSTWSKLDVNKFKVK